MEKHHIIVIDNHKIVCTILSQFYQDIFVHIYIFKKGNTAKFLQWLSLGIEVLDDF